MTFPDAEQYFLGGGGGGGGGEEGGKMKEEGEGQREERRGREGTSNELAKTKQHKFRCWRNTLIRKQLKHFDLFRTI